MRSLQTGLTVMLALRCPPCLSMGCFDQVLRSAARLIGGIPKFSHVLCIFTMFSAGSILSMQRISYRIASLVWRCLLGLASVYLRGLCCPLLNGMSSRSLRSSQQGLLLVPFARTSNTFRGGSLDLE